MSDPVETLQRILVAAIAAKARRVRVGDIEVELDPSAFASEVVAEPAKPLPELAGAPTVDELLFWSSPLGTPRPDGETS